MKTHVWVKITHNIRPSLAVCIFPKFAPKILWLKFFLHLHLHYIDKKNKNREVIVMKTDILVAIKTKC